MSALLCLFLLASLLTTELSTQCSLNSTPHSFFLILAVLKKPFGQFRGKLYCIPLPHSFCCNLFFLSSKIFGEKLTILFSLPTCFFP